MKFTTFMTEFEYAQARSSTEQERLQFLHNASTIPAPTPKPTSCHAIATCLHTTKHWSDLFDISSMPYLRSLSRELPCPLPLKPAASSSLAPAFSVTSASTITLLLSQQQRHLLLVNHILLPHLDQLLSPTRTGPRPRASIPRSRPSQ